MKPNPVKCVVMELWKTGMSKMQISREVNLSPTYVGKIISDNTDDYYVTLYDNFHAQQSAHGKDTLDEWITNLLCVPNMGIKSAKELVVKLLAHGA